MPIAPAVSQSQDSVNRAANASMFGYVCHACGRHHGHSKTTGCYTAALLDSSTPRHHEYISLWNAVAV
eukprot:7409153-Alexandrium_andersonii.AAC.1